MAVMFFENLIVYLRPLEKNSQDQPSDACPDYDNFEVGCSCGHRVYVLVRRYVKGSKGQGGESS